MSALFSASAASMDTVLQHAALYGLAAFLFGYLGKRLIDLWINSMGRQSTMDEHAADALRLARKPPYVGFDDPPEIAPEDEPSWGGKAPHDSGVRHLFALHEPSVVLGGNPARFDLAGVLNDGFGNPYPADVSAATPEETSGRHARVQGDDTATGLMPAVVDDEPAMAVLAVVSGGDGAT